MDPLPRCSAALGRSGVAASASTGINFNSHRRGSEQAPPFSIGMTPDQSQPRRSSLGNIGVMGTANDMLRAASAMAAQASSGAEGLQAVSSALINQAKAQAHSASSAAAASSIPASDLNRLTSHPRSVPMSKTWSDSATYSAAMSAHIASALQHQMVEPPNSSTNESPNAPISAGIDPRAPIHDSTDPEIQMGQIAAKAAAIEAQTQWRTQVALRSVSEVNHQLDPSSSSPTTMAWPSTHSPQHSKQQPTSNMSQDSVVDYLKFLGLSHIAMPSEGVEQAFGRKHQQARYWDATNPHMGFSLSGVPSMPLMPTPPLQMLPPPASPSFRRRRVRGRSWIQYPSSASSSSTDSEDVTDDVEPNVMSPFPYPFQIVQTPGGTARAGWWVPPSEVSAEKRAKAVKMGASSASTVQLSSQTNVMDEGHHAGSAPSTARLNEDSEEQPFFQPTYRGFTRDEYSTLATAAAYATAALTSIASTPGGTSDSASWRPLQASEQEAIAAQLRAWAGLEGPDRQEEARKALQERQLHLISQATHHVLPARTATIESSESDDVVKQPENAARFFPPDFASHYRTQLNALAEGYYTRLHNEGLSKAHYAQALSQAGVAPKTDQAEATRPSLNQQRIPQARLSGLLDKGQPPVSTPELGPDAQDPVELLSAASNAAGRDVKSPEVRDQLLQYAHGLYSQGLPQAKAGAKGTDKLHPSLLPLLHTLHKLHPTHLPTLLLLSCAYYAADNYAGSLWYNNLILRIDPNYVESMSNIGTTLRALGRHKEAESWWWRAIKLRPGYWDAYENLLGVMCSPAPKKTDMQDSAQKISAPQTEDAGASNAPRFKEALQLCDFVEGHILGQQAVAEPTLPQYLPPHLPITQAPRLQNLFYAKGNLKYVLPELGAVPAAAEYQKAIELALSPDREIRYSLRDLVVATCAVGLLSMGVMLPGTAAAAAAMEVAVALGMNPTNPDHAALLSTGMFSAFCPGGILTLVKSSGQIIVDTLLRLGDGQLPMLMLLPEAANQLCKVIFAETAGVLPALAKPPRGQKAVNPASLQQVQKQAAQTMSTILLTLAKLFQDATSSPMAGAHGPLRLGGIPPSISLLLPLYYLSISLHPSASTCNNLGILLSSIPVVTTIINAAGQPQQLNGQALAMQYYTQGLQLDPNHPHIYTNLGSLLKDLGHLNEAIKMYEKAVECNPNFDVALANLGNAIKDQGRTQDSVAYYRRAVQVNPNFPEALCGLVNALLAICDWREVYGEQSEAGGDAKGWMQNVSELVTKQLKEGLAYGAGAFQTAGKLEYWVDWILKAMGDTRPSASQLWTQRLSTFYQPTLNREAAYICEGGYLIQLIERMMRKSQRRWYLDVYGPGVVRSAAQLPRIIAGEVGGDMSKYLRPKLPSCLITPAVPTVLPFHTFTYPLSPRQIRLICHRNAVRISQSTLTQVWLPEAVYPPPCPPAPKIHVGYVSSDLNNHPLAHLMQSVFGFHDPGKFEVFLYATTPSDGSPYRHKIESEAQHFLDVSSWSNQQIVERIVTDNIHILVNLNGYTKGARNEIFASRPCPVQMEFMGFAGSMASRWTDWVVADPIVCPPEMTGVDRWRQGNIQPRPTDLAADLDPEDPSDDWVYSDRFIYMPFTYFVNDHKQGFRENKGAITNGSRGENGSSHDEEAWAAEEARRYVMRKELFPGLPDDYFIFADFNQLYKCDPMLFKLWLRILKRVPKSILWLLRFPASGEPHLLREARKYVGDEVASRVIFTDVAPKHIHIHRGRIAELFLDTTECNAHTTAADILWSATPVLTWPRHLHKMCSRVAASIVYATGFGDEMTVNSEQEYEDRAVLFAESIKYTYYDQNGQEVQPVVEENKKRFASELEADPKSIAAQPHSSKVASNAASQNPRPISTGGGGTSAQSRTTDAESSQPRDSFATSKESDGPQAKDTTAARARSASLQPPSPAPAPTGVSLAQAAKFSDANVATDPVLAASIPPRRCIVLPPSPIYPGAVTRRSNVGSSSSTGLAQLRKKLFLTRESESKLFDTKQWVRDLEKGYEEAWTRWVLGVDTEDSPEVEALDPNSPLGQRIKKSGHIWVKDL